MKRLLLLITLLLLAAITPAVADMDAHFLDVGHGDCIIVVADGECMIVDGGNPSDSDLVFSYLLEMGVKEITAAIATHPDSDHIGGLPAAFHAAKVTTLFAPTNDTSVKRHAVLLETAQEQGAEFVIPEDGYTFALGNGTVTLFRKAADMTDDNNTSIVVLITYGGTRFLLCGDIETAAERRVLDSGVDIRAAVLKVAHHGSPSSSSEAFVRAVAPTYAVISGDEYTSTTDEVPARLIAQGSEILHTDALGHIVISTDGENLTVSTEKKAPKVTQAPTTAPSSGAYIGNRNSKVFHRASCGSVKKMKDKNKVEFGSADAALKAGYKPCKNCKP